VSDFDALHSRMASEATTFDRDIIELPRRPSEHAS
jgi:hypothetical protein